jgi:hypothetical protein
VKEEEEEWVADPPTRGGWPPLRPWGWPNHPLFKKKKKKTVKEEEEQCFCIFG